MNNFIRSPLNYTGNKFKILPQIIPHFPKKIGTMVDLFCGGATVGINVECEKVIFIDNNKYVINLLKFLSNINFDKLLAKLLEIINEYNLSCSYIHGYSFYKNLIKDANYNNGLKEYNSTAYYKLRSDYNLLSNKNSLKANTMLYVLMLYGFNNDIRFSKEGKFNLPVGKTDLNKSNILKLQCFIERMKTINSEFVCGDFESTQIQEIIKNADFVYMDPPYLITTAVYNETTKWREQNEYSILKTMNWFIENNKSFVLSNVLEKKGKRNEPLYYWTETMKNYIEIINIEKHYRNASYNKLLRDSHEREVIILPRSKKC